YNSHPGLPNRSRPPLQPSIEGCETDHKQASWLGSVIQVRLAYNKSAKQTQSCQNGSGLPSRRCETAKQTQSQDGQNLPMIRAVSSGSRIRVDHETKPLWV